MFESVKRIFQSAVEGTVNNSDIERKIYRMEYDGKNLIYTRVYKIPKIVEYIDDSLDIVIAGKHLGYFFTEDMRPDGIFSNPAVLCVDGNYYIYNEHYGIPKYFKSVMDWETDIYPESLADCEEVLVIE